MNNFVNKFDNIDKIDKFLEKHNQLNMKELKT